MNLALYKIYYDDKSASPSFIDRATVKNFAQIMDKTRPVNSISVLIKSKVKCKDCGRNPVWNEGDECSVCKSKNTTTE